MRKITLFIALAVLGMLVLSVPALGAEPVSSPGPVSLKQALPADTDGDQALTRGMFAVLLVQAANLPVATGTPGFSEVSADAWYAGAIGTLIQENIMRGYPDGGAHPEQPVTLLEASVMCSRVLGLPGKAQAPQVSGVLAPDHWGYTPYAWLVKVGLLEPARNANEPLTVDTGIAFLESVFSSDPRAEEILLKSAQAESGVQSMQFSGDIEMKMSARDNMPALGQFEMKGTQTCRMILPLSMYSHLDLGVILPPGLAPAESGFPSEGLNLTVDMYLKDGILYEGIKMIGEPGYQWIKMELPEGMQEIMTRQNGNSASFLNNLPEEMVSCLYTRYLGRAEVNGKVVDQVAFYGRFDDLNTYLKRVMPQEIMQGELGKSMEQLTDLVESISYWGVQSVGVSDSMTCATEMSAMMGFGESFMGQPIPFESMEMKAGYHDIRYNSVDKIEVPAEAINNAVDMSELASGPVASPAVPGVKPAENGN